MPPAWKICRCENDLSGQDSLLQFSTTNNTNGTNEEGEWWADGDSVFVLFVRFVVETRNHPRALIGTQITVGRGRSSSELARSAWR